MLPTEGGTQVSGKGHYGTWAASGEIDIVELIGHQPEKIHGTFLYGGHGRANSLLLKPIPWLREILSVSFISSLWSGNLTRFVGLWIVYCTVQDSN